MGSSQANHSTGHNAHSLPLSTAGVLITLGIVFGDIGTSPLYVVKAIIGAEQVSRDLVLGGISCVFWTLIIITTIKYVVLALNADNKGEGGIFALYALVRKYPTPWVIVPAIIGCASLIADGFLTPPISISSAIEGLRLIPGQEKLHTVPIVVTIMVVLFAIQQFGTNKIGFAFGPIMVIWFSMIGALGVQQIMNYPSIWAALNPYYALNMVFNYTGSLTHISGFWVLGAVFLCTTGGEALYSDLGHCGKQNIRYAWAGVFVMLILNYLGQGAWVLNQYEGKVLPAEIQTNGVFYAMAKQIVGGGFGYKVVIGIASAAAIIASQALITGCFTLVNEAIKLKLWINMRVSYPTQLKGQIYIPAINWFLLAGCLFVVWKFEESTNMEGAYGVAIIINMMMTSVLLIHYLHMRHRREMKNHKKTRWEWWFKLGVLTIVLAVVELSFFISNAPKFTHGGWFSFLLAAILSLLIFVFYLAKRLRKSHIHDLPMAQYIPMLKDLMEDESIPLEATNLVYLTMSGNSEKIESNIVYSIFKRRPKRADIYWFVNVEISDDPHLKTYRLDTLVKGKVFFVKIKFGFKVEHKVNLMFHQIIKDMRASGEVDEQSHYESLRKYDLDADFKFIILNSRVSVDDEIKPINQFIIRAYRVIKRLSLSTQEDFGLELSNVQLETVPISIKSKKTIQMTRE